MEIELVEIKIRDLVDGYEDLGDHGVFGYGGRLDIRPPYQREFVYKDKQRAAVIDTVLSGFPLNSIYWSVRGDGSFEVLDGQQRIISVCQYVDGDFSVVVDGYPKAFHNLPASTQDRILDYGLMVYICEGDEAEKLDWFQVINIAGVKLTDQELRNAVYAGPWVSAARAIFSRSRRGADALADGYVRGDANRQEILETAIRWLSRGDIEGYMSAHQHDPNANQLWQYFQQVINWAQQTFPVRRSPLKSVDWGTLFEQHGDRLLDPDALEVEVQELMALEEVTKKSGIYPYVLDRDERHLNIRAFNDKEKLEAYERQRGRCVRCGDGFELNEMEGDHIVPFVEGGRTTAENLQLLCIDCNRRKSKI